MNAFNVLSEQWIPHLWAVSWQVSILFVIIWIVDRLSRKATSSFRYWLWCIVLFRLCIPVNLTLPRGIEEFIGNTMGIDIPEIHKIIPELMPFQDISDSFRFKLLPLTPVEELSGDNETITPVVRQFPLTIYDCAGILWCAVVVLIGTFILTRMLWIHKRLKECPPVDRPDLSALFMRLRKELNIRHTVGLHYMDIESIDVPAVIGVIHPRIFLPRKIADEWSIADIKPVLLHELAHVKRLDLLLNWLQVIIQVVYFFHPLVWLANSRIRQVREELCDDIAVNCLSVGRKRYTLSIIRVMEETCKEPSLGFVGIGFTERKSSLAKRIKRIMSERYRNNIKMTLLSVVVLIIIGAIGIFLSFGPSALKDDDYDTYNIVKDKSENTEIKIQDTVFPESEFAATSLVSIADYYYNIQNYEQAIAHYEEVLEKYPDKEVAERVPETLKDLRETVAYIEFEKGWNIFLQAQDTEDPNLYSQALEIFNTVINDYPGTESEVGALSNAGICYEALNRWLNDQSPVKVMVLNNGEYEVAGIHATSSNLREILEEELAKSKSKSIVIYPDSEITQENLFFVMDVANELDVKGVGIKQSEVSSEDIRKNQSSIKNEFTLSNQVEQQTSKVCPIVNPENAINVFITENGEYEIGDKTIASSGLLEELQKIMKESDGTGIVIHTTPRTRYKDILFVMKVARNAGIKAIAVITEQES